MVKQIISFKLSAINNGAHFSYVSEAVEKIKADSELYKKFKELGDTLAAAVTEENLYLITSRKNSLSDKIKEGDKNRANFYRGYRSAVKHFLKFPEGDKKQAASVLQQHLTDYNIDPRMQLDRETGLLTNFIEDLEGKFAAHVATLSLAPYIEGLKKANEDVRNAISGRDSQPLSLKRGMLRKVRKKSDEAYAALVRRVNALAEIEGDSAYAALIAALNEQIKRFKQEVIPSSKKVNANKTKRKNYATILKQLIPAFEKAEGYEEGVLSYSKQRLTYKKEFIFRLNNSKDAEKVVWVKIVNNKLEKVEYPPINDKNGSKKKRHP